MKSKSIAKDNLNIPESNNFMEDYESKPVPLNERQNWVHLSLIWIGGVISLSATALGGTLGMGMSLPHAIIATLIGSFILALLSSATCIVGAKTGISTSLVSAFALGRIGAMVVSLVISISLFGWFGVQLSLFGETLHYVALSVLGISFSKTILIIFGGVLMTVTAMIGYKAIDKLSIFAVPLLTFLLLGSLYISSKNHSIAELSNQIFSKTEITLGTAISTIIGSLAVGAIIGPDYSRYSKSSKDAVIASFLGFFVGNSLVLLIAAILAKITGNSDIVSILVSIGWGVGAMLVLILAQWTTNNTNIYSSALNFSTVFKKIPRYAWSILAGTIGTILAILGIYSHFITFLIFLSMLIPPIGGIYTADYLMNKSYYSFDNIKDIKNIRLYSILNWIIASVISFLATAPPIGLGIIKLTGAAGLDSFIAAFIIQIAINKFTKNNLFLKEE